MGKNTKMIPNKKSQDKVSGFQNLKSILLKCGQVATYPKKLLHIHQFHIKN